MWNECYMCDLCNEAFDSDKEKNICPDCFKQRALDRCKMYKQKHRKEVSEYNETYKKEHKSEISDYNKLYDKQHRAEIRERQNLYQKKQKID